VNKAEEIPKPTEAAGLLRREPRDGFRRGAHLRLADLADGGVTRFLSAEAAPVYLTLLYALLLFRRRHELDPLHTVLFDEIRPVVESQTAAPYSLDAFASDVNQLVEWGCLKREVEAERIRGYRDRSRDHFRYTLTSDTVSFLEWLEGRLDHRVHGTLQDGRDLLLDLTQRLNEAAKIVRRLREGGDEEDARRLIYLLESADNDMDAIGRDLTVLRAEMHAYSRGLATADDLRRVVDGLERYVARYVRRLRELGGRAYMAARRITRKPALDVLARAQEKAATEGGGGPIHPAGHGGASSKRDYSVFASQRAAFGHLFAGGRNGGPGGSADSSSVAGFRTAQFSTGRNRRAAKRNGRAGRKRRSPGPVLATVDVPCSCAVGPQLAV
jgi:hypothetical protein